MCQAETAEKSPDRDAVNGEAVAIRQLGYQIGQRQIRALPHTRLDPVPHVGQLAMPAAIALPPQLQPTVSRFRITMSLTNFTETRNRAAVDRCE